MIRLLSFSTAVCLLFLSSCVSPAKLRKEMVYFNEGLDTAKLNQYQLVEPIIQKGDLLNVSISSRSSAANQLFSQNYSSSGTGPASGGGVDVGAKGYLVDITTGEIKLPLLGIIHADGMTKLALEREIIKRANEYLNEEPIVNVRYQNFRVTFHGMVGSPGEVNSTSERLTFLDALAQVGGIAPGGNLKNILIIREQNGKRTMHTVDLTKGDFFQSPNYYLKQNDIVYVAPTDRQVKASDQSVQRTLQYVSFGLSLVNVIVVLSTIFR